jgi:hypothetical protein
VAESRDDRGALTPIVGRFRRLARLAATDPLRVLPVDPVTRLAWLGAPVEALIAVAPFERLRQAVASATPDVRQARARGRARPPAGEARGGRPSASPPPAGSLSRAVKAREAVRPTHDPVEAPPRIDAARAHEERRQRAPSSGAATLAERRAAARRASAPVGTPSERAPSAAPASAAGGRPGHSSRSLPGAGPAGPGESVAGTMPAPSPRAWPALLAELRAEPHDDDGWSGADGSGTAAALAGDGVDRADRRASARTDVENGAVDHRPPTATAPVRRGLAPSLDRRTGPPTAAGRPSSTGRTESLAESAGAGRRGAGGHCGRFELADDLFEALYRDGVDLSWP